MIGVSAGPSRRPRHSRLTPAQDNSISGRSLTEKWEGLAKFESALLNRGLYGGIAHIAFRDQAIQNLDDHVANPPKSTETQRCQSRAWFRPASQTDRGGDRGDMKDNLAHGNPTRPCSVFGAIEE